jgi:Flp pilus assembly protein TadD
MAQKALLLETSGRIDAAQGYATLAARREPQNWRYALLEARLSARRGDTGRALTEYRRAKQFAPRNPALP